MAFQSRAIGSVSLPGLSPGHRLKDAHKGTVDCLALSPDGSLLASGGREHRVVLRDPVSFDAILSFPEWVGNVRDMAFDASSRRLAIVGSDPEVEPWELAALSDGPTSVRLPRDRPSPAAVSTAGASGGRPWSPPEVVDVHPGNTASNEKGQSGESDRQPF